MKVIEKALQEAETNTEIKPKKGWWGFKKDSVHFLMRYGHTMLAWNEKYFLQEFVETRTDKAGVNYAKKKLLKWSLPTTATQNVT